MNQIVFTYLLYLAVSVTLTVWVARKWRRNGRAFLVDVFHGNESLADSVSQLLAAGFYLINLGYVSLALTGRDAFFQPVCPQPHSPPQRAGLCVAAASRGLYDNPCA
jgi:hypothetical protein